MTRRLVLAALRPRVNWATSAMLLAFAVGAYLARDVIRNEWRA